jgi:Ca2+-binding RTX toxin-like protein
MSKRLTVFLAGAAMATLMLAVAGIAWAQSPTLNQTPDDIWMTNSGGKVYAIIRSGEYIYVGGQFTSIRSAASGGQSFAATNLARFDADTGVGDPTWTPDVTGADMTKTKVYSLAAANGKIWVGGNFAAVNGVARRNLAAVSPDTGAVDLTIDPVVGTETSIVRAMIASSQKVYIGGAFGTIQDDTGLKSRRNIAALDPTTGNVDLTWKPKVDKIVWSLAFSCPSDTQSTVFAGGKFLNAAGSDGVFSTRQFIARFDATSGALHPWAVPPASFQNQEEVASDLAVTCERITSGFLGPNFLRSFRLDNGNTGSVVWEYKTGGEVQTAAMLGDDKVIVGGHFSQLKDGVKRERIGMVNLSDGSVDPSWAPPVSGKYLGPWDLLVDDNHLYVGGEFTSVAGLPRYNFTRFSADVPDTTSPTVSTVVPADGATEVALDANAEASFSEAIDPATITNTTFTLTKADGTLVTATVGYDPTTKKATLNPGVDLESMVGYTATLKGGSGGVKDLAGNPLATDKVWSFTTTAECTLSGVSTSAETITGTPGDDVICGGAGPDTIMGLEGNDILKGEGGADMLFGGIGDDTLDGGIGTDTANYSGSTAAISASLLNNSATGEGLDALVSVENLTGSNFADDLTGSAGNNSLNGAAGADAIVGKEGADTLTGAGGNDTLDSRDEVEGNDSLNGGAATDTCTTDATEKSILNCEQ